MSGGSMNYLYQQVENAEFQETTPERAAFREHLEKVARALHDIEWNDSNNGPCDENASIRACVSDSEILIAAVSKATEAFGDLQKQIDKIMARGEIGGKDKPTTH